MTAIFLREFKGYFNSMLGWVLTGVMLLFGGLYFTAVNLQGGYTDLSYTLYSFIIVLLIFVPLLCMRSFAEEKRSRTDQLLLTSPVSIPGIVMGKYLSLLAMFAVPLGVYALYPLLMKALGAANFAASYSGLLAYFFLGAALIAVSAWISIPADVPFTLQTFAIFSVCGLLGGKRGTVSVLVYLLLGAVGAPVYAGFAGGFGPLMGSTGGYILGFLLCALTMWSVETALGKSLWALGLGMVLGLVVCYAFGTAWFMVVYTQASGPVGLWTVLGWCVIPFIGPDLVKIALALALSARLRRHVA